MADRKLKGSSQRRLALGK